MIGTGTGLAPYMSMIRNELALRVDGRVGLRAMWQRNGPRHFVMVHGARYSWDLGYRYRAHRPGPQMQQLPLSAVVTRPGEDGTWRGRSGYVQDVMPRE